MSKPQTNVKRREKVELKSRMKGFLMFLPNMVKLMGGLITDSRVSTADKALFIGAIVYVISPLDFIPDFLPFIGQVDDVYVVALCLLRLLNHTNENVVREHWAGGGDIVSLANTIASLAPKFLPKRVSRVLTARVELAPAGKILENVGGKKRERIVVEKTPKENIKVDSRSAMTN
jgi:uncharacterized membrane protein YkvA (DUF1232 family)